MNRETSQLQGAILSVSKLRGDTESLIKTCNEVEESGFATQSYNTLSATLDVGRKSFVEPSIIERADKLLQTLDAKRNLEAALSAINQRRPCKSSQEAESLQEAALFAKSHGVDIATLQTALKELRTIMAEVKLLQYIDRCKAIQC